MDIHEDRKTQYFIGKACKTSSVLYKTRASFLNTLHIETVNVLRAEVRLIIEKKLEKNFKPQVEMFQRKR